MQQEEIKTSDVSEKENTQTATVCATGTPTEASSDNSIITEPSAQTPAESATDSTPSAEPSASEATEEKTEATQEPVTQDSVKPEEPQVIIQKERGFAHYVGFALLCVLCILFFFIPGIALTFAISLIPGISLGAIAAWTFGAILSVIAWFIFKLKIKGFKKSFYFYIGLCILTFAILVAIEVATEKYNLFSNIFALLTGAN